MLRASSSDSRAIPSVNRRCVSPALSALSTSRLSFPARASKRPAMPGLCETSSVWISCAAASPSMSVSPVLLRSSSLATHVSELNTESESPVSCTPSRERPERSSSESRASDAGVKRSAGAPADQVRTSCWRTARSRGRVRRPRVDRSTAIASPVSPFKLSRSTGRSLEVLRQAFRDATGFAINLKVGRLPRQGPATATQRLSRGNSGSENPLRSGWINAQRPAQQPFGVLGGALRFAVRRRATGSRGGRRSYGRRRASQSGTPRARRSR